MDLNEQEKGILIGVVLTVIAFYTFSFFFPSQTPSESDIQQEEIQQTRADRLLNEPLGLYTGIEKVNEGRPQRNRHNALKKMVKGTTPNKKAVADKKMENDKKQTDKKKEDEDEDKKKEDEETEEDDNNTDVEVDNSYAAENTKDNESPGIAGVSGSFYPGYMSGENENTEELDTIEEWIAYFVNAQSLASIDRFTNAYLSQKISSDIFYSVIEELLTNFREKLKHYGIIALSKTPSRESFEHLVHITESDHHEQKVQSRAMQSFNMYTQTNHLNVVAATLSSSKDNVRLKAIKLAVTSAQLNLKPNSNSLDGENQNRQRQRLSSSGSNDFYKYKNVVLYQSLKEKLENMAQRDHNSAVRTQAGQAANTINELLQQFT